MTAKTLAAGTLIMPLRFTKLKCGGGKKADAEDIILSLVDSGPLMEGRNC